MEKEHGPDTSTPRNGNISNNETTEQPKLRSFKLLADPALVKCAGKLYRFDGIIPNDPNYPAVVPRDPRNPLIRIRTRPLEPIELFVPRYPHFDPSSLLLMSG